ncbi:hypothetical protein [Bradyrhizobium algeriense]|uniref:hypothetical protein n=1 Tax=Bradyrhizobium algeriense TaxID=634784 RepID=UPI000D35483C|nr:hypothetical protein [Bradyrhizobium algeriense]
MKALIALIAAIAGVAVTLAHLKEGVLHFHLPKDLTWTTAGTLLFSVIALVIGLAHLRHSIKVLMQRNVICTALVVVFAVSLLSLVVGGAWLFGMIFIDAFRSEKHIVLVQCVGRRCPHSCEPLHSRRDRGKVLACRMGWRE